MPKILVACVGNIFLGDDAFAIEVARRLEGCTLPTGVCVTDFGIRSYDLAYALIEDWELVILVDAVSRGGAPGTLYVIEPELPQPTQTPTLAPAVDAHTMDPVAVLRLVDAMGGQVRRMLVVGCEPARTDADEEGRMELSESVSAAVDEAVGVIHQLIDKFSAERTAA